MNPRDYSQPPTPERTPEERRMSESPHHWYLLPAREYLHASLAAPLYGETSFEGKTACGMFKPLVVPGLLSRFGAPRCKWCCGRLGVGYGAGLPENEELAAIREAAK